MADLPIKPDGTRMTRSQALLISAPLASPLISQSIPSVTPHKKVLRLDVRWWVPVLAVLCLVAGYAAGSRFPWNAHANIVQNFSVFVSSAKSQDPAKLAGIADQATPLKSGPWGNLEAVPMYIEVPDDYLPVKAVEDSSPLWHFVGYNSALLSDLFDTAALSSKQKAELLDQSKWVTDNDGITISPSSDLVLSLSPQSRKVLYGVLSQFPVNAISQNRCYFPAGKFDEFFAKSGISPDTLALVKKLSYPHGNLLFFCDAPLVMAGLNSYTDKLRLMKALTRKSTLLLRLHVMPNDDINALSDYWIRGKWGKDGRTMLESLIAVPGGARMGVGRFFPPRARDSLYTFPYPSTNPDDAKKDCHWTALNFFNDPPDNRYLDVNNVKQRLTTDYYPVMSDFRYGDILELVRENGDAIHSCVYIAGDVVYTKNSAQPTEPVMLMTLPDLLDTFSSLIPENETLKIIGYRNKSAE